LEIIHIIKIINIDTETGTILEINAYPKRLDLNDVYCRMAKDRGVQMAIGTGAHNTNGLAAMEFGVDAARRGWLKQHYYGKY